jgi:putative colanic acid biosynthesis acetyltransferase WcaF
MTVSGVEGHPQPIRLLRAGIRLVCSSLAERGSRMEILDARQNDTWRGGTSFTLRNRIYRIIWTVAWRLLAAWTPPPLHGWRRLLLRLFGAKVAPTAGIYPSARIWSPANLEVGDYAFIGPRVIVYSMAKITFAPYALVSQGAHICTGTHDIEDDHFQLQAEPIVIGYRAWIAAEAFVGPGVIVGDGAVLGARSCAFENLEPWTVYVGNPARAIKPRKVRFPGDLQKGGSRC